MNRLQRYYEQLQFPLKSLLFGSFLIFAGSLFTNPYLVATFRIENELISIAAKLSLYAGGLILTYFAVLFFVKLLSYRVNEPNIVVTGIIAYIIFTMVLVFMTPNLSQPNAYVSFFKVVIGKQSYSLMKTGVFGILAVYLWIRFVFRRSKKTRPLAHSYLDTEVFKLVNALFGAVVLGLVFSWVWPLLIDSLYRFMVFVASDQSNPMSLFAYGLVERILNLSSLDSILHQEMWFGELGGSWLSSGNETFVGDVNIWAAQLNYNAASIGIGGAGRYTSAYYVLNLFAVPAYLWATLSISTNKKTRRNNAWLFMGAVLLSATTGILLPFELMLLLTTPALYLFHLFMTSFTYAVLGGLSINIGFSYLGSLMFATPGNIIDLLGLMTNRVVFASIGTNIMIMLLIGFIIGVVYFVVTRVYYSKMALDPLNISNNQEKINDFIEYLGGLSNITAVSNTPMHLYVSLKEGDRINVTGLHRQGVTRIVETRFGYILSYGCASYIMQKEIKDHLNKQKQELLSETETQV